MLMSIVMAFKNSVEIAGSNCCLFLGAAILLVQGVWFYQDFGSLSLELLEVILRHIVMCI